MIIYKCNVCKRELTQNMISERLVVNIGNFTAEVVIREKENAGEGHLCYPCLLKALNNKPKRKYTRKPKAAPSPDENTLKKASLPFPPDIEKAATGPDISTFLVKIGTASLPHKLSLGGFTVSRFNCKDGVRELLDLAGIDLANVGDAPDSEGKRQLLAILGEN